MFSNYIHNFSLGSTAVTPDDDEDDGGGDVGLIVGITIGAFAGCIIVILLLWFKFKRNNKSHSTSSSSVAVIHLKETK